MANELLKSTFACKAREVFTEMDTERLVSILSNSLAQVETVEIAKNLGVCRLTRACL